MLEWDKESDVVIVGYGAAGAAAAITAHDAGAKVIILEKNREGGGNSKYAAGSIRQYVDITKAIDYFYNLTYKTVDKDMIRVFVEESSQNPEWIKRLGVELELFDPSSGYPRSPHIVFPHVPGSDGMGRRWRVKDSAHTDDPHFASPVKAAGLNLFAALSRGVASRGIEVQLETPAKHLIANEAREVIGVLAEGPGGEVRIKAKRGVILTCGSYEFNEEMQLNYLPVRAYSYGNPGNTGDGIKMAQEVGADLWHMNAVACGLGYRFPDLPAPMYSRVQSAGFIYVDQNGKRFMDESATDTHAMMFVVSHLDLKTLKYDRVPSYVVFDDDTYRRGPVGSTVLGTISDYYQWSSDNAEELKRGWIKVGKTIEELAPQIGLDPETLQETVAKWNMYCVGGYDPDFKRGLDSMEPVARPPFYAIALWPCLINTQGGPKRNAMAQVLDPNGKPIRRLYSAGELGSLWGALYPGAGNLSECLAFGRIAGRNATGEEPW